MRLAAVLLLCMFLAEAAGAGTRAIYRDRNGPPLIIEFEGENRVRAQLSSDAYLLIEGDETIVVEERLTGPIAFRLRDIVAPRRADREHASTAPSSFQLSERGTVEIHGRVGRAFFGPPQTGREETPLLVVSGDPALAELGRVMRRVFADSHAYRSARYEWPEAADQDNAALSDKLSLGAPIAYYSTTLRSIEQVALPDERFESPVETETPRALEQRLAAESSEEGGTSRRDTIARAVYADGRLWLLNEGGQLSTLVENAPTRQPQALAARALDICVQDGSPLIVTGVGNGGERWEVLRWADEQWMPLRSVTRESDVFEGIACGEHGPLILTSARMVDLASDRDHSVRLSERLAPALVAANLHATADTLFLGIAAGEWGGGLRAIDRRTGQITVIERNATGDLCDGPLNTECDPVHGVVTMPWRRECVVAAVGLIHMLAHGRLVSVCPDGVEQILAVSDPESIDPEDPSVASDAGVGRYGSVAFFGLAARGQELIAAGHNGIHRLSAIGTTSYQPWPRFVEVDGILLSFALPDVVLVMTDINRRASVSGISPLLVVR